ncbi:MAG: hypothetical protein LLG01_14395 [Planctomycetaceae bacterium]|nr:hypothetical protein [Planctomycetaceae bacterium]
MGTITLIIVMVILTVVLMTFELLTPSMGLLTVLALAAGSVAVWQAFTLNPTAGVLVLLGLLIFNGAYLWFFVKVLPNTRLGNWLYLKHVKVAAGEGTPEAATLETLVGKTGTAETLLRPSGAVRIDGRRVIALAESGVIPKGTPIKVIKAAGTDVIVRQVNASSDERVEQ